MKEIQLSDCICQIAPQLTESFMHGFFGGNNNKIGSFINLWHEYCHDGPKLSFELIPFCGSLLNLITHNKAKTGLLTLIL